MLQYVGISSFRYYNTKKEKIFKIFCKFQVFRYICTLEISVGWAQVRTFLGIVILFPTLIERTDRSNLFHFLIGNSGLSLENATKFLIVVPACVRDLHIICYTL